MDVARATGYRVGNEIGFGQHKHEQGRDGKLLAPDEHSSPSLSRLQSSKSSGHYAKIFFWRKAHKAKEGRFMPRSVSLVWAWTVLASAVSFAVTPPEGLAFQLTEPKNGAVVKAGESMNVKVAIPPGMPVVKVTYTLYEEDRAPEDRVEALPTAVAQSAPFDAAVRLPPEMIGGVRLVAVAQVAERRGQYVLFDETSLRVEPDAALTMLQTDTPVRFTKSVGEVQILSVRGVFSDKVV